MLLLQLVLRKSSKLSFNPNCSSAYVKSPMLMIDIMFSLFLALGLLTTMMKSCSAFGPSFSVILLVSSLDIGFSMYHASCFISEFTIVSVLFPELPEERGVSEVGDSLSRGNGSSGLPNFSLICFLLNQKLAESTESSTICSELVRLPTLSVEPSSFPGKNVL